MTFAALLGICIRLVGYYLVAVAHATVLEQPCFISIQ